MFGMADTRDTTTKCRGDRFITEDGGMSGVMCPGCEKCKHLKPMKRLPDEPGDTTTPTKRQAQTEYERGLEDGYRLAQETPAKSFPTARFAEFLCERLEKQMAP